MSVRLTSKDRKVEEGIPNVHWAAIVAFARAFEPTVPDWNGCHDGQEWTPEHLQIMATRLEETARLAPILRDLAKGGGVTIS